MDEGKAGVRGLRDVTFLKMGKAVFVIGQNWLSSIMGVKGNGIESRSSWFYGLYRGRTG